MSELRLREVTGSPKLTWLVRSRASFKSCPLIQNLHVFLYLYIYSLIQEQQKSLNARDQIKK